MKIRMTKSVLFLGAAFSALVIGGTAQAQDSAAATATADEPTAEIVVTAERRPETLRNTPVSVAVIGGQDARDFTASGDDTLLSLSGKVPSFYAETTTGRIFPRFYIRGLGNIDFYLGASQPVSIVQDDVVLEHVVLKSNPVYDLDHVEVLRGPQGSLFGRNTTAGIVKFDTVRPTLDRLDARGTLSYGSYNSINLDAGIGGPLGDNIAVRVSGLIQHRDNYVDNAYAGVSQDGTNGPRKNAMGGFDERDARIQVLVKPTEGWTSLFSAHMRNYNGTSTLFLRQALKKGSNDVSNVSRTTVRYDEAMDNPQDYDTYGMSWNNSFDFGPVTLTSITAYETSSGYSRGDTDGGAAADYPVGGVPNGFGQSMGRLADLDQWTQEVRLASNGDGPFKWQVGGMYFDSRDITEFYQRAWFLTTAARNPNNWVRLHDVNTSWALFGQASYQLTPKFRLTAGVRVTEDTKTTDLLKTANTVANVSTYTGRRHVRLSDTQPSWDVSALYEVNDDLSLYARVARGFRGPTIQGRSAVFNSDFTTANSETIVSYEAGLKSSLFDNKVRFNLTGFYYTVDDIQLNGNDSNGNGVLFNADKAEAYGVEAELNVRPVRNLALSFGASWLHSEIKDKRVYAQVCALNGIVVCTVNDPVKQVGANYFAQIDGNPLPNAPKYNLNATARYDIPVSDSGRAFISTDWNIQGYTNYVLYKTNEFYSDGNFEGGLKVGYTGGNGTWEIAAFARNITNEKNLKGVIENYMAAVLNEPRVIGISLTGRTR
ncbi:TonB-dependent receptor [Sphingomonas kyeonggiensis]|uniref:Iron complex outermembrane receptor protein n=1 Tax=Sphingomonas kyeonggiensis TaxID=1268553 RepID=A0A7W6JSU0_9SPHN|nr:TonB-dependent receptor [Sphingomonas kyeonggiensis]MBB4098954.1 iron complex outermembrane receptor protein [Sphingomonas kyeonggiensis]